MFAHIKDRYMFETTKKYQQIDLCTHYSNCLEK